MRAVMTACARAAGAVGKRDLSQVVRDEIDAEDADSEFGTASVAYREHSKRLFSAAEYARIQQEHPPIGAKKACYFFFKRGSCLKGDECHYHHGA